MEWAPAGEPLHIGTVGDQPATILPLGVVILGEASEAELAGDVDLLAACELELGAAQRLNSHWELVLLRAERDQNLADIDTGRSAVGLSEGAAHTCGETIGSGAGERLVDTQDLEGVRPPC